LKDFNPSPVEDGDTEPLPPLSRAENSWREVGSMRREFNTMPQWAGSCWYYLRFIDPKNPGALIDPAKEKYWMPVDLYVGGAEHSVLHLLYARFWHKVLYDIGVVSTKEPFKKLVHQGMILGQLEYSFFRDSDGNAVSVDRITVDGIHKDTGEKLESEKLSDSDVSKDGEFFVMNDDSSIKVDARAFKMSKSRGNVVNPDEIITQYGADSLRLYEMFMGPLKDMKSWSMRGVDGVHRFLNRVWRLVLDEDNDSLLPLVKNIEPEREHLKQLHRAIKKVNHDIDNLAFNTAISAMMVFVNEANKWEVRPISVIHTFLKLLNPFAPHISEEIWQRLGQKTELSRESWPEFDEKYLQEDEKEIVIQINGKLRSAVMIPTDRLSDKNFIEEKALADEKIVARLASQTVRKVIIVPGKLVNIVAG